MSVIQDALKRRLAEQQQGKIARGARPAGGAAPPPTPPVAEQVLRNDDALNTAAAAALAESRGRAPSAAHPVQPGAGKWIFGTALVMLFAVLVAGVLWYLSRGIPLVAVPPPADGPTLSASVTDVPNAPAGNGPIAPGSPNPIPAVAILPAAQTSTPGPTGLIAVESPPDRTLRSQWPAITVDGVMAGSEPKKRSAILNGQMIFLNQKIEDVRLVEVRQDGVRLRFRGEEIDLEIGQVANDLDD